MSSGLEALIRYLLRVDNNKNYNRLSIQFTEGSDTSLKVMLNHWTTSKIQNPTSKDHICICSPKAFRLCLYLFWNIFGLYVSH